MVSCNICCCCGLSLQFIHYSTYFHVMVLYVFIKYDHFCIQSYDQFIKVVITEYLCMVVRFTK